MYKNSDLFTLEATKETPPLLVWRALMGFPRVGEIRKGFLRNAPFSTYFTAFT